MGAICITKQQRRYQFYASFSVMLEPLFQTYKQTVIYLRQSQLFKERNDQLGQHVDAYSNDIANFDKTSPGTVAVDIVHKLHPLGYSTEKVDKEWLINACLRQHKFAIQFPMELLNFKDCYKHYVEFLYLCYKSPEAVIVPSKLADFMWHSHMQDNAAYKKDIVKMLKKVLNHVDDYDEQKMKKYARDTERARKALLPSTQRSKATGSSSILPLYHFIYYGHGGGSHQDTPHHHHHHDKDHHHPDKDHRHPDKDHHHPDKDHHHPDKDHHHPDKDHKDKDHHHKESDKEHHHHYEPLNFHTNTYTYESHQHGSHNDHHGGHNDNYGGHNDHVSNCGGGVSNCGGGEASNCGGGGSSCGGCGGGD